MKKIKHKTLLLLYILVILISFNSADYYNVTYNDKKLNHYSEVSNHHEMKKNNIDEIKYCETKERTSEDDLKEKKFNGYTSEELNLLARLIQAEADVNNEKDMLYVGCVVMNRVQHESFADSIVDVIYSPGQYSTTWNGRIENEPSDKALEIAYRLASGERYLPDNVVYQAQFIQGNFIYEKVGNHYYCGI